MASQRVSMPSSQGGIMRYFDEYKSKITFKPGHIIVLIIVIILIELILHAYGKGLIGL